MPTTYPLDLTGNAGTNLITNELHTFNIAADRIFPLTAGPFYTIGLEVYHGVTNQLLQPVTQYKALHLHRDASLVSGKEVCAVIIVEDATIPSVRVKYQCIGGLYSNEASLIQDLIDNNPIANDDVVWGQIIGIPVQFPPTEHLHHFDNIYGAEEMVAVLERIRMAIAAGDSPAIAAIYQYIHTLLTNLDYQTEQQVIDLISGGGVTQHTTTYKTYALLREETNLINNESYLYVATGKNSVNDRKGKVFMWDIACTTADDDEDIIRPNHIDVGDPGRFVCVLLIESKFKTLAASLGRGFTKEGVLLDNLVDIQRIYNQDLNTLISIGPWFFGDTATNKPPYVREGFVHIGKAYGLVFQECHATYMDFDNTTPVEYNQRLKTFKRVGVETPSGSGTYVWSEWANDMDLLDMRRHGISSGIATYNTLPANTDADTVLVPGKYFTTDTTTNVPEPWGILEVELISGDLVTAQEIEQSFKQSLGVNAADPNATSIVATRRRFWDSVNYVWTPWRRIAGRNGDYTQTFAMYSPDINAIDPSHGVNAAFLATQFATLWARLTDNGIDATIGETNVLPAYTDLDGVINVGKYWVGHSSGYYNSPFDYGILEVEKIDANNIIQTMYDELRRTSRRTDSAGTWWTEWTFSQNLNIAYESSRDSRDLDWTLTPGEYFYTPNTISRPTPYGLVKVWRENNDIVYQQAHSSDNTLHTRYRSGAGIWTPWRKVVTTAEISLFNNTLAYEGYSAGGGIRLLTIVAPATLIGVSIRLVSAGGSGGGGGGTNNNGNRDYGGGGGGGGGAGGMLIVNIPIIAAGSVITITLGAPGTPGAGGGIGSDGVSGTAGAASNIVITDPVYGNVFVAEIPAGAPGTFGWKGGINSQTAGSGGGSPADATISVNSIATVSYYQGTSGAGGDAYGGGQGNAGGYGGYIPKQTYGYFNTNTPGAPASNTDGYPGQHGVPANHQEPYQFGRAGSGGGGGVRGQARGGPGGEGGPAGVVLKFGTMYVTP